MRIVATDLGHHFADQPFLFRKVNFNIGPGDLISLTGPSGSGKTTLLNIVAGWISAREGHIERHGQGRVSWVFQNPHGVPGRTALDHVVLPLIVSGRTRSDAERVALELMSDFTLEGTEARPFRELSGGEAQRLMLARAVASEPGLLLVDEPTAQLDRNSARIVIESLHALAGRGCAVLVSTHDARARQACMGEIALGIS